MKITVIGCSTTWTDRPTSSYCINDNILVDAGEGTIKNYDKCKIDIDKIEHIFITHMHTDHTLAVVDYIYNALWHYQQDHIKKLNIYGLKGIVLYFKRLIDTLLPDYKNLDLCSFINFHEITDFDSEIEVGNLKVKCFQLKHGVVKDIAYVFDDNTTKVGFSGDCTHTETLDKFVKYCDVLFLECCDMKTDTRHLGYDKFIEYVKLYKDKKFYGIHCTNKIYFAENKLGITLAHSQDTYTF